MAQKVSINKEIKKIDSLIEYNTFDIAKIKTDSLYKKLNTAQNRNRYKAQLLEIQYQQAVIFDRKDDSSPESLKILLDIEEEAEAENLHVLSFKIFLLMALAYEKANDFNLENKYLDKAYILYKEHKLEKNYSTYCIRKSSYYRLTNKLDSSYYYAREAKKISEKHHNEQDIVDSYMLLRANMVYNSKEELDYEFLLLKHFLKLKNNTSIALTYSSISSIYCKKDLQDFSKALVYSDSAYTYYNKMPLMYKPILPRVRSKIFEAMGKIDSSYHYFKQYNNDVQLLQEEEGALKTKKLEKQYQNDKREDKIRDKDNQMILIGSLLAVIVIASILLLGKNRQINNRNKIINQQLGELTQLLKQKKYLLSELQHRVKNNLQHVISILEIQKESADFNNIEELIRGNQNRIHSMALLHKKLNVSDNVNDVDFKRYITELSDIVKESYDNYQKKINLNINCDIETITIGKALPIGFILVELISNSMKHAFKERNIGLINIEIIEGKNEQKHKFYYSDNGDGFDFNQANDKGLGLEITKGLIDQIDGIVETKTDNGFELIIYFK